MKVVPSSFESETLGGRGGVAGASADEVRVATAATAAPIRVKGLGIRV